MVAEPLSLVAAGSIAAALRGRTAGHYVVLQEESC
jgi:hypothetical protein